MIGVVCLFLLISLDVHAAQLGRITESANFRTGPSLSAPIISRLEAGTEVEIIGPKRPNPGDWYFVVLKHGKQSGFVHKGYVRVAEDQRSDHQSNHHQLAKRAGMILAGLGIVLMASVLAPDLLAIATALGIAIAAAAFLDVLFQVGMLYSLSFVSVGVFALFLFFGKKSKGPPTSIPVISQRKAA